MLISDHIKSYISYRRVTGPLPGFVIEILRFCLVSCFYSRFGRQQVGFGQAEYHHVFVAHRTVGIDQLIPFVEHLYR
ncbi:hypothetical protein D9M68_1003250 [compost metagenome]